MSDSAMDLNELARFSNAERMLILLKIKLLPSDLLNTRTGKDVMSSRSRDRREALRREMRKAGNAELKQFLKINETIFGQ